MLKMSDIEELLMNLDEMTKFSSNHAKFVLQKPEITSKFYEIRG